MTKTRSPVGKLTVAWLSRRHSPVLQAVKSQSVNLAKVMRGEVSAKGTETQPVAPLVAPGWRWPTASFAVFVLLPTIAWFVFAAWFSAPEYVSESRFVLRGSVEFLALEGLGQSSLLSQLNNAQEAHVVADYIRSDQIVSELGSDMDLSPALGNINFDPRGLLALYTAGNPVGESWRRIVRVDIDPITGIVTVRVRSTTARVAREINADILRRSAILAAKFNSPVRGVRLEEAEKDATEARHGLIRTLQAINGARTRENILNPIGTATDIHDLISTLREERALLTAGQTSALGRLNASSPAYGLNEERIRSLDTQIAVLLDVTTKASGAGPREDFLGAASVFDLLEARRELAVSKVAQAESALAEAQINASRKSVYMEVFMAPTLGEQDARPHALVSALIILAILSACWGIGALYIHSVRERIQ